MPLNMIARWSLGKLQIFLVLLSPWIGILVCSKPKINGKNGLSVDRLGHLTEHLDFLQSTQFQKLQTTTDSTLPFSSNELTASTMLSLHTDNTTGNIELVQPSNDFKSSRNDTIDITADTKNSSADDFKTDIANNFTNHNRSDTKQDYQENSSTVSENALSENSSTVSENALSENSSTVSENALSENSSTVSENALSENSTVSENALSENSSTVSENALSENSTNVTRTSKNKQDYLEFFSTTSGSNLSRNSSSFGNTSDISQNDYDNNNRNIFISRNDTGSNRTSNRPTKLDFPLGFNVIPRSINNIKPIHEVTDQPGYGMAEPKPTVSETSSVNKTTKSAILFSSRLSPKIFPSLIPLVDPRIGSAVSSDLRPSNNITSDITLDVGLTSKNNISPSPVVKVSMIAESLSSNNFTELPLVTSMLSFNTITTTTYSIQANSPDTIARNETISMDLRSISEGATPGLEPTLFPHLTTMLLLTEIVTPEMISSDEPISVSTASENDRGPKNIASDLEPTIFVPAAKMLPHEFITPGLVIIDYEIPLMTKTFENNLRTLRGTTNETPGSTLESIAVELTPSVLEQPMWSSLSSEFIEEGFGSHTALRWPAISRVHENIPGAPPLQSIDGLMFHSSKLGPLVSTMQSTEEPTKNTEIDSTEILSPTKLSDNLFMSIITSITTILPEATLDDVRLASTGTPIFEYDNITSDILLFRDPSKPLSEETILEEKLNLNITSQLDFKNSIISPVSPASQLPANRSTEIPFKVKLNNSMATTKDTNISSDHLDRTVSEEPSKFLVLWNIKSRKCITRYGSTPMLTKYGITHNQHQHFYGDKIVIFYAKDLGFYPRILENGEVINGGIPQLANLDIHLAKVRQDIDKKIPNSEFSGFAIIDWECWRPIFRRNWGIHRIYKTRAVKLMYRYHPSLSYSAVKTLAKKQFDQAARRFMETTLKFVKSLRPRAKWGFYLFPDCYNFRDGQDYCHKKQRRRNNRLFWMFQSSGALYPSIYLTQRMDSQFRAAHVKGILGEAYRIQNTFTDKWSTPVMAYARIRYGDTDFLLSKDDLEDSIGQAAMTGASGVILWERYVNTVGKRKCFELEKYLRLILGPFLQTLQNFVVTCSQTLCKSHGRCVQRKHSRTSGESKLGRARFVSMLAENKENYKKAFRCECNPGWTGSKCGRRKRAL